MNLKTLQWLNQWFLKIKYNNIIDIYYRNKYTVNNENSELPDIVKGFIIYLYLTGLFIKKKS
jgi:hypothetical protein